MLIKKIAGFTLIAILLDISDCFAQDTTQWTRGLRFGYDLSRLALYEFQPERKAMEFSFDTEIKNNMFTTVELGEEQTTRDISMFYYKSSGYYGRFGVDFNILKRDKMEKGRDIVYIGFRYGYYHVKQQVDRYMIPSYYPTDTAFGSISPKTFDGHWLECIFGLKVEVLKNLFLGASLRGKVLLYSSKGVNYPYYMPGFGKGANSLNFGVNYSIYYQIPLMKVKYKKVVKKLDSKKNK
jgi:hypothetical protein